MKGRKFLSKFLKLMIIVLSLGNLVALFVFHYKVPDFIIKTSSSEVSDEQTIPEKNNDADEEMLYSFNIDSDTLTYDGNGKLDLLSGISVITPDDMVSDMPIFAHVKTGNSVSEKIVEYTADTPDGRIEATRTLKLVNYNGPSIKLPDSLPQIEHAQLDSLLAVMPSDGSFFADDGFGNDITKAVTVNYELDAQDSDTVHYVFTVTNSFNDTVYAEAFLTLNRTKPVIVLKESAVTIALNSHFNALEYVRTAEDVDGASLFTSIIINGNVNTGAAGVYTLTYTASSPSGMLSDPKVLTVTVQ